LAAYIAISACVAEAYLLITQFAQMWREPSRGQANLARLLAFVDVRPVDQRLGRSIVVVPG